MSRKPLPLGTWGKIRTYVAHRNEKGKPDSYRAMAYYRDFDGKTRQVEAYGKTKTAAETNLVYKLKERSHARHGGALTSTDRFSVAAELWFERTRRMVTDGKRSPGSLDTYRRQLDNHVLPALGEVRLGEAASTPLIDKIIQAIKTEVGAATAKTCRSVISGVLGLAVRHGAIQTNPVRDIDRIEATPHRKPRALEDYERTTWFQMLANDQKAVQADLPDLTTFMLGTGARIGETLGVIWEQINFATKEVEITHQIIRVKGQGLLRIKTKSRAGERVLRLPSWCMAMLQARFVRGVRLSDPIFSDVFGGFRDPTNVRRDLRDARSPVGSETRQRLGMALRNARQAARLTQRTASAQLGWSKYKISLIENGRIRIACDDVVAMLDLYDVPATQRSEILALADAAGETSEADALGWITSHSFRKTTATILDDAGQSARQIADQLGHARPSMTQDVYMGRRAKNPAAADALEGALDDRS